MWKLVFSVLLALPSLSVSAADLVFRNGDAYTVDATRSWASAVAIEGNQIVYVGGEEGVQSFARNSFG
jgi:predicted amidohydrolase YtcJ